VLRIRIAGEMAIVQQLSQAVRNVGWDAPMSTRRGLVLLLTGIVTTSQSTAVRPDCE
jgi:hypothetical protein